VHVDSIVVDTVRTNPPQSSGRATVVVVNDLGDQVAAAVVQGSFTGDLAETGSATSANDGTAVLTTDGAVKKPSFTFCVDDVSASGLTYVAGDNMVTCASYP
jgi:hypothetical protein